MSQDNTDLDDTTPDVDSGDHKNIFSHSVIHLKNKSQTAKQDDNEPQTMDSQFFEIYNEFETIISDYITEDKRIKSIIDDCMSLNTLADRSNLWSNNELFEDIQTDYIKFALLASFLSQLYSNRNPPNRVKWLQLSNYFTKLYLNRCDQWNILSKKDQNLFDQLKSRSDAIFNNDNNNDDDDNDSKNDNNNKSLTQSLRVQFEERNDLIERHKLDTLAKQQIATMLSNNKSKHSKPPSLENKWKLFKDDENEREFWEIKLQVAIRQALRTLKQNMDELPLSRRMEKEAKERKSQILSKYDSLANSQSNVTLNTFKEWQPRQSQVSTNINNINDDSKNNNAGGNNQGSGNLKVTMVDSQGKMKSFDNLGSMKYALNNKIDNKIEQRVNSRNLVFRDPNPWTYTAEQAAKLGLLPEIPKDYFEKQKERKKAELEAKHKAQRYAPDWETITNMDDGSQLHVGQIEFHKRGNITTFTDSDIPKTEEEKHIDDMTEAEYNEKIKEMRYWDAFKDDNTKGSGNPYYN